MGEHTTIWRTLGYSALFGALVISLTNVGMSLAVGEGMKKTVAVYGVYGVGVSLPLVVFSGRFKNFFSIDRIKRIRNKRAKSLDFGEFLLADERPHPMYFAGIMVSIIILFALSVMIFSYEDAFNIYVLAFSLPLVGVIHVISKRNLLGTSSMKRILSIWSMIFAIWWSISVIRLIRFEIESAYPLQFWEQLIGIPSTSLILLALILFLFSSIFWRIDSYLSRKNRGPVSAVSIVFMGAGISSLFPPLWALFSDYSLSILLFGFFLASIVVGFSMAYFLLRLGGMRITVTNRRILLFRRFISEYVAEYPYDSIRSVEIKQGLIGRRFGYGDMVFTIRKGGKKAQITLHGVRNPVLIKNTVLAMSSNRNLREGHVKKPWTSGLARKIPVNNGTV